MSSKRRREHEEQDRRAWCLCIGCWESPAWRGQPLDAVPLVHYNTARYHLAKREREGASCPTPAWPHVWIHPRDLSALGIRSESLWPPTQLDARIHPYNVPPLLKWCLPTLDRWVNEPPLRQEILVCVHSVGDKC